MTRTIDPVTPDTFSGRPTINWSALEAEAKRVFGSKARVGYKHVRPDIDRWRAVGYVGDGYPVLLPRD